MNFERQIIALRERETPASTSELAPHYERLHEIYAQLDEPDGMEGISMLILSPSLEHKIRQHESTGQWTAAQSCWEVGLQRSPDNLEFHLGLMRCLRNLGHYGLCCCCALFHLNEHGPFQTRCVHTYEACLFEIPTGSLHSQASRQRVPG